MSTETQTVRFQEYPVEVVVAFDSVSRVVTILTEEKMVGGVYLGAIDPVPEPDIVETEPIVEPEMSGEEL
jgi:hypothetical protein